MCNLLAQRKAGRRITIHASDEELRKKKKKKSPSKLHIHPGPFAARTGTDIPLTPVQGTNTFTSQHESTSFYKIFPLRSSSPHVPNRPSVFRTHFSSGLKQPITALNPCRKPLLRRRCRSRPKKTKSCHLGRTPSGFTFSVSCVILNASPFFFPHQSVCFTHAIISSC